MFYSTEIRMAQDIVVETRGKNIVVGMPGTTLPEAKHWPTTCSVPLAAGG
jgi:hypothetical protein